MLRFSHSSRLFLPVSFEAFAARLEQLHGLITASRPQSECRILTCEDRATYAYAHLTFDAPEIDQALENRKRYALGEFGRADWKRSLDVQATWKDSAASQPFMICLSCDRANDSSRVLFYGQELDAGLDGAIRSSFRKSSILFGVGNGFSKPSPADLAFGERLTGIRLG